jgi:hypothetical protein
MMKFGIYKKDQLTSGSLNGFLNGRKFIALDLYGCMDDLTHSERDQLQERILSRFSVQSGVLKYTHSQRFEDFDVHSLSAISANFQPDHRILVHDIGASDGRTSCGLYKRLNPIFRGLDFLASDYAPYLYRLRRKNSDSRLLVDELNHILQIITPPFVFTVVRPESKVLYPLNHLIRLFATLFYARPLLRAREAGQQEIERTRIELLCQECRLLSAGKTNFHFEQYDVMSGPKGRFDVIRAMNVLNTGYFTEERLRLALTNIALSLNEGGLFVTGSNTAQGTMVDGGIYKMKSGRMEKIMSSGAGSQIDALITSYGGSAG